MCVSFNLVAAMMHDAGLRPVQGPTEPCMHAGTLSKQGAELQHGKTMPCSYNKPSRLHLRTTQDFILAKQLPGLQQWP